MRHRNVSKRPFGRGGGGFSAAKKLEPDRLPTMDDLIEACGKNTFAVSILNTARRFGIGPERFGRNRKEITDSIGAASFKFSRKDKGYCRAIYAVASIIIAQNDHDTAKWLINEIVPRIEEKEVKKHLENASAIMGEAKNFGVDITKLGGVRKEDAADEVIRIATNNRHKYPKVAVAIVLINQKAEGADKTVSDRIVPECTGSELYELRSYVQGRVNRDRINTEDGRELIVKISKRIDHLWMSD